MTLEGLSGLVAHYGYLVVFGSALVGSAGIPLPATELLIAAAIYAAHDRWLDLAGAEGNLCTPRRAGAARCGGVFHVDLIDMPTQDADRFDRIMTGMEGLTGTDDKPGELPALWGLLVERPCHLLVESAGSGGMHAYWQLAEALPGTDVALEHSRLPEGTAVDEVLSRALAKSPGEREK